FLVDIEHALLTAGHRDFQMVVVGDGDERPWLERNLHQGVFTGVLRDHALAEAYANMDLFIFPSRTDTFGNVIQEAAASGVPAVVTAEGGPMQLVVNGVTGFIAQDDREFVQTVLECANNPERLRNMGQAARENLHGRSWDSAFEMTYSAYRYCQASRALRFAQ
ncbi:MAG TPA: glycosyltransferase, partial [Candidatus Acidoferrum sp.]|nr:glycosyltransferase [Candidatus Acidoferrum sp.]